MKIKKIRICLFISLTPKYNFLDKLEKLVFIIVYSHVEKFSI